MVQGDVTAAPANPGWRRWTETWYLSYALLGASVAGLAPILLPLSIGKDGSIADIGLVMGAFNLGGLTAPVWGGIADRKGQHRLLLVSGLLATAFALFIFPFVLSIEGRILLALVQGAGAASAATVANLAIVEVHPRAEWDERIGWLQTFYGGGQVLGLLLAGFTSGPALTTGFVVAAAITFFAILPAMRIKSGPRDQPLTRPVVRHPSRHAELSAGSPQSFYHHLNVRAFRHVVDNLFSPLGVFLCAWFVSFAGAAALFSLYPVLMKNVFGVDPSLSSIGFAVAASISLFVYAPAGRWSRNRGPLRVLDAGLIIRVLAFTAMIVLGMFELSGRGPLALASFAFVVVAWSLLSVAGTEITAQFSEEHEGEGLGLFNASTSIAGVVGAVVGGWTAERWGYNSVLILGILGSIAGIVLAAAVSRLKRSQVREEET